MSGRGPERRSLSAFVARVAEQGRVLYRDLAWRRTRDPYAVLVSEVMLQQTQVSRVEKRYGAWLESFPTIESLAAAPLEPVLEAWQGLGYNRRAIALKRAADQVAERFGGKLPRDEAALRTLPGIGQATAAGIVTFAYGEPSVYLETNVRAVFLHELFADSDGVPDREILPLARVAVEEATRQGVAPRDWCYALLDYGAHLKRTLPNPSRRSLHHARQSRFEGSRRQKRAWLLRAVMAAPGLSAEQYAHDLTLTERDAGRDDVTADEVAGILEDLALDGFLTNANGRWFVA